MTLGRVPRDDTRRVARRLATWPSGRPGRSGSGRPTPTPGSSGTGPSMSMRSFLTARLMEAWAHGQDVVDAVGAPPSATDRLRARRPARRHHPRLELSQPGTRRARGRGAGGADGAVRCRVAWGDADSGATPSRGPAEDFCLVVTQRRHVDDTRTRDERPVWPATGWSTPKHSPGRRPRSGGGEEWRMRTSDHRHVRHRRADPRLHPLPRRRGRGHEGGRHGRARRRRAQRPTSSRSTSTGSRPRSATARTAST